MLDTERFLSARSRSVDASGIRKVFDLGAKLVDPINLSIGQPDFAMPAPARRAAIEAIEKGFNGYTVTQGIAPLRDRLAAEVKAEFGADLPVLVTSGVSGGIVLALMALLNPGDEVVIGDPYFVIYKHAVKLVGGVPVTVDTYPDFRFDAAKFEAAITPKTKLMVIASPSNPTGVVLSTAELESAARLAAKHNIILLVDEIYNALSYDGPCPAAPVSVAPERVLVLRGFSKSYSMTGWRLGYATGPKFLVDEMTKLQQYTFVCAPSVAQHAALAALDADISGHVTEYRAKRDLVWERLSGTFEMTRPGGGFYFFPRIPARFASDQEFVTKAIENNVLIIPGSVFSDRNTHFRLSYATSNEKLEKGCEILTKLARG